MKSITSIAIKQDLPELAEEIVAAAKSDPGLEDVLKDYEQACERMSDALAQPEDQTLWAEIRGELAAEIRRLCESRTHNGNSSSGRS